MSEGIIFKMIGVLLILCSIGLFTQIYYAYNDYKECDYDEVPCYDEKGNEIQELTCEDNCNESLEICGVLFFSGCIILMVGVISLTHPD